MLKVGFTNATSLKLHIPQLKQMLTDNTSYDIVGVAETRLGDRVNDHIVDING